MAAQAAGGTVDLAEVEKFERMAAEWWDPRGKFRPLHLMNPVRLDYAVRQMAAQLNRDLRGEKPLAGLRVVHAPPLGVIRKRGAGSRRRPAPGLRKIRT